MQTGIRKRRKGFILQAAVINILWLLFFFIATLPLAAQQLYEMPEGVKTRWISFENPTGAKGAGGMENKGAKGHAYDQVKAGETVTLLDVEGAGIIQRIWMTISDRSPRMLRSLRIDMYWDGAEKPAVSVPLGDFFGIGLGRMVPFESALFTNPEGRSFNCYIPMPFKDGARITITNESDKDLMLLFYDINLLTVDQLDEDVLYFHAYWSRDLRTELGEDFEILPHIEGKGRFLGVNMGILTNPVYEGTWWGEGEVKIYLDGDDKYPTLVGTGTEDYIGTAWGQGTFAHQYQGSLVVDKQQGAYAFYRYHIPDPVYFYEDIKVTIQQIGGAPKKKVIELVDKDAPLIPISSGKPPNFVKLLELPNPPDIHDPDFPEGWTNFYRSDDVSATAYFYLNKPVSNLPPLAPVKLRTKKLRSDNDEANN